MTTESFGANMPAGQPVAIASGDRALAFAVSTDGRMNVWSSSRGEWSTSPGQLPGGNLVAAVPCAVALPDGSAHVYAIANGGGLVHWSSPDGDSWVRQAEINAVIHGGWNGLAVASPDGQRMEVFATTNSGVQQFSFAGDVALPANPPLPESDGLPTRLLAATSASPGNIDVFAVDPASRLLLHWRFDGAWSLRRIGTPVHVDSGIAAVSTELGRVQLFAIADDGTMRSWSAQGMAGAAQTFAPEAIPPGAWALPVGIPAVVARGRRLDLFAIGQGGIFNGGPLVHWRFDEEWREPRAYDSGLGAGGLAAVRTAHGMDVFGIQSGSNNPLLHWPAGIGAYGPDRWSNWAGNRVTDPIEGHCEPTCLEELVAIVRTATHKGKRVRAVGSSWSFSDIAVTSGYVVETRKLNRVLDAGFPAALIANPTSVDPGSGGAAVPSKLFVHVEAGIQLEELMTYLDSENLAPATMGGASGQTLAGVVSTSVHGSHFRLPPISDWVRAIHLVGPDGAQYWIEPADRPITDPNNKATLQDVLGPEVTILHDDAWFDTVLVSVGSLGIVYSYVLEVRYQYTLREKRTAETWSTLRPRLLAGPGSVFTQGIVGLAVTVDAGSVGSNDPNCILVQRDEVNSAPSASPSFDALGAFCEGDMLIALLFKAGEALGTPAVVLPALMAALELSPLAMAAVVAIPGALPTLAGLAVTAAGAATTAVVAADLLIKGLKVAGPGAIGDLVGRVLNQQPALVGALTTLLTTTFQGPGETIAIAHNAMGPKNKGECATRGLGLEIACDAGGTAHLDYIDAALALLRDEAAMGRMLGGWFSIRFVGRSRAILSPQRTAMTCMVEFVGLRTLDSTYALFAGLEALGREHGGIQHWGMAYDDNNLVAADVDRAYPRLDVWKQTRRTLTRGGVVRTFDNHFTARCGLSDSPIRIQRVVFDPPGSDISGEQVVIVNETAAAVELSGWTLRDAANHVYSFPTFVLEGDTEVTVWTKSGTDDPTNLFWGRRAAVWNNKGDTAIIMDERGIEMARFTYPQ
ncbi:MAG: lamin tail domain-containing protein [Burkholderiales bacterium]|nr:lamin tail domain-containing protein [Burkholderiales bacterium]